ncbi:restriction endonuclease [Micromonospora sp. URMC 106]|uniref:restriction endonuclease n=1 Tax=Micromonospora sp. URMC 106 TaxID=3423408 RepID=UPI003F1C17BA
MTVAQNRPYQHQVTHGYDCTGCRSHRALAIVSALPTLTTHWTDVGLLVTTSGYGPASDEFASGKPLKLIDGSSLLHLLPRTCAGAGSDRPGRIGLT